MSVLRWPAQGKTRLSFAECRPAGLSSRKRERGDAHFLPGYCLLLPDSVVPDLNALSFADRQRFLLGMTILGDALLETTEALRINYEILGNTDPALRVGAGRLSPSPRVFVSARAAQQSPFGFDPRQTPHGQISQCNPQAHNRTAYF